MFYILIFFAFFSTPIYISKYDHAYPLFVLKAKTGRSRFGDCLTIIYNTLYLSHKYKIPVFLQEFKSSSELEIQKIIDLQAACSFKNKVRIINEHALAPFDKLRASRRKDTVCEIDVNTLIDKQSLDKEAQEKATQDFKRLIKPIKEINVLKNINKDCVTIAVHVRKGGGYDLPLLSKNTLDTFDPAFAKASADRLGQDKFVDADELAISHKNKPFKYSDVRWPFKFPPDSFYVEQIIFLYNHFKKPLHVHIFTDDPEPIKIMQKYKNYINNPEITFSCRETGNAHDKNIIEDFFAMTKFDCLIRPVSYFSENIERLGDFKIIIFPEHGIWVKNDVLIIDRVKIIINPSTTLTLRSGRTGLGEIL